MFTSTRRPRSRGVAALAAIVLLLGATLIGVAYGSRALIADQRAAAAHLRSVAAFEAAQAGLEWGVLQLNRPSPVDAACTETAGSGASLRARMLAMDAATAAVSPLHLPGSIGCNLGASGWSCDCAGGTVSSLPATPPGQSTPGFRLRLTAAPRPGTLLLTATGCADAGASCAGADGAARLSTLLALLPALKSPPAAPVLATGRLAFGSAVALANLDAHSGGLLAAAGGEIAGAPVVSDALAGTPAGATLRPGHPALSATAAQRLFEQHTGLDRARWASLPSVAHVECEAADCGDAIAAAYARGARMVHVSGAFEVDAGSASQHFGSDSDPVLIVADGPVVWRGAVRLVGALIAPQLDWQAAGATPGSVRGAIVATGDVSLLAPAELRYDSDVMRRLTTTGTFVPVAGSWRDF